MLQDTLCRFLRLQFGKLRTCSTEHTPYMSKRFKQETGVTFSEYLKHVRIDASRRLLINTDKSVAEISELVGYMDTTFFHNTFRTIVGCTPLEYRKNHPNDQPPPDEEDQTDGGHA